MSWSNKAKVTAGIMIFGIISGSFTIPARDDIQQSPEPELAAMTGFSQECQSDLFKELSEISTHSDDPRLDEHAELISFCHNELNQNTQNEALFRLVSRNLEPLEGLINFESPHVHPIDITPNGNRVVAVNTAGATLEVFDVADNTLFHLESIPVGLDPVSVRVRNNTEVWVINHMSDSISVVDLDLGTVTNTIDTDNEPADVIFAGTPTKAFVSISEKNKLEVYDLSNLTADPLAISIIGQDPRALAVSADRQTVYVGIFESSNGTTLSGSNVIVQNDARQSDNDVAVINANSFGVSYQRSLMNMIMSVGVNPSTDRITVVGTQATNHIAQEPNLNGTFVRVLMASFFRSSSSQIVDLNPHLNYVTSTISASERVKSIGDPRGIAFSNDGNEVFVTGMGSNNVIISDDSGNRLGRIEVGEGPTGIVMNPAGTRAFVLNKFAGSISVLNVQQKTKLSDVTFYDPTPDAIKVGRPFLYNTHLTSGLGQVSCASCHVDARYDRLAWDLSNPNGSSVVGNEASNFTGDNTGNTVTLSPIKGPMVTQTLQDLMGHNNLHWRGDREELNDFDATFVNLMGAENQIGDVGMDKMGDYLVSIWFPPNPYRNIDDSRPRTVTLPNGNTITARADFLALEGNNTRNNDCLRCHTKRFTATRNTAVNAEIGSNILSPPLTALYDKIGLSDGTAGFGFFHNGVADIFRASRFSVAEQDTALLAELLTVDSPTGPLRGGARRQVPHAGVGKQITISGVPSSAQTNLLNQFVSISNNSGFASLIAKTKVNGQQRGFAHTSANNFDTDRSGETASLSEILTLAGNGSPVTFTIVAKGTETRLGIDKDFDGAPDGDSINSPPIATTPANQSRTINDQVAFQILASDAEGDNLSYVSSGLPIGLSLDVNTGLISGSVTTAGNYSVTVTISDGQENVSIGFLWVVENLPSGGNELSADQPVNATVSLSDWDYYSYTPGENATSVLFELDSLNADVDLYVRANVRPTGHANESGIYDCGSIGSGAGSEQCSLPNTSGTIWHIGVYGYRSSSYRLTASEQTDTNGGGGSELTSGETTSDVIERGAWHFYEIDTADDDTKLTVDLSGLSADVDLYVRAGSRPTNTVDRNGIYDCHSVFGGTSAERCVLENTVATTWHIGVYGYQGSAYELEAVVSADTDNGNTDTLVLGSQTSGAVEQGGWQHYTVTVPGRVEELKVTLTGLQNDADIYVRANERPSGHQDEGGQYDCSSLLGGGSSELCVLGNTQETVWHISIYGYRSTEYVLLAESSTVDIVVTSLNSGQSVSGSVPQSEWRYFKIGVPGGQSRLQVVLTGMEADGDLFVRKDHRPSGDPTNGANSQCISVAGGDSNESCIVANDAATDWFIGVYGYNATPFQLQATASNDLGLRVSKSPKIVKIPKPKSELSSVDEDTYERDNGSGGSLELMLLFSLLLVYISRTQMAFCSEKTK